MPFAKTADVNTIIEDCSYTDVSIMGKKVNWFYFFDESNSDRRGSGTFSKL